MTQHAVEDGLAIRQSQEELEDVVLHPMAARSFRSAGRETPEPHCVLRTDFQRDRDRIIHSKAFRRLKQKTQVFISPAGDHYRTRLTHTLEVSQIARTIARALRLNEDLTESIALGHDLGHPPFGHTGERVLNECYPGGFCHMDHGLRIVTKLEPLNLTKEVLDGLSKQKNGDEAHTLEAKVVELADRMAYLHHDVEDAVRAELMRETELPAEIVNVLGGTRHERLDRMVIDIVRHSRRLMDDGVKRIAMSPEVTEAMLALRGWMFEHIYLSPARERQSRKVHRMLTALYGHLCEHPEEMSVPVDEHDSTERHVVDYIAGMTDRFAIDFYIKRLLPLPFNDGLESLAGVPGEWSA